MDNLRRAVILTELMDRLRANGSWCGHTHMQMAVYFLQEILGVPTAFEYILHMHSPYSYELMDELTRLRADFLMEFNHRSPGFGPGLVPTQTSVELRSRFPVTLGKYAGEIDFIARAFGAKEVLELDTLATALYVTRQNGPSGSVEDRARRLAELKPHVSFLQAVDVVRECDRIIREAEDLALRNEDERAVGQAADRTGIPAV
jgi:hypothetical protein